MRTITATFEVVTPMFLGGADHAPMGIRPSSVKGALRFWWRAWAWSSVRATQLDDCSALRALHAQEARLFGLAADEANSGQGLFAMHVRSDTAEPVAQPFEHNFDNGILYLLGQGLGSFREGNHCTRAAIPEHKGNRTSGFEIRLIFKPQARHDDVQAVCAALELFGLLGALGSRARHGFGSVAMTAFRSAGLDLAWQAPPSGKAYKAALRRLLPAAPGTEVPPLTALSGHTRIDISLSASDPVRLLAQIGREQQAYRSFGKDGRVNGKEAERNFHGDHDLVLAATEGRNVQQVPDRVVFGLPHNYFFSSTRAKADVNFKPEQGEGRRASPLLLHIHRLGDQFVAIHTLLKAQFLPPRGTQGSVIEIRSRSTQRVSVPETTIRWEVLHGYLDRYKTQPNWESLHG